MLLVDRILFKKRLFEKHMIDTLKTYHKSAKLDKN